MALKKSGRLQAYFKLVACVLPNLASLVLQISQHQINSPPNRLTVTLRPKFLIKKGQRKKAVIEKQVGTFISLTVSISSKSLMQLTKSCPLYKH